MKKNNTFFLTIVILVISSFICVKAQNQNVGIGTLTPNSSAMLDVVSTTKGVLVPRVSTVQMNAIAIDVTRRGDSAAD